MTNFFQVQLRTNDVEAARAFYAGVLGPSALNIVQLHEQAVARGARPHWIGYLEVSDVDQSAALFTQRGAIALGPTWVNPEGLQAATMRDPGGAIVALAKPPARARAQQGAGAKESGPDVVWYSLHTADVERAKANYAELVGWEFAEPVDLGELGILHPFRWQPGTGHSGSMHDITGRPGIHPHWLFHFRVAALEPAIQAVRAAGGSVLGPVTLPSEERMAICDDAQGAAFALREGVAAPAP
jgi:predicted enzyme related to lactoylglutathione lyase